MNRRGFTAPELTTALLLIAVGTLVVIAREFPARNRALDTSCLSNVKQLGLGLHMYALDWGGRLPPTASWGTLHGPIMPYVKNAQIFICPRSARTPEQFAKWGRQQDAGGLMSDYLLKPAVETDELPGTIIAGDDAPNRHRPRGWVGVRLDGAAGYFLAGQWQQNLGWVMNNEPNKR